MRKQIFADNLELIERHNAEEAFGIHTYKLGVNRFADMTEKEYAEKYTGFIPTYGDYIPEPKVEAKTDIAESIDWREKVGIT